MSRPLHTFARRTLEHRQSVSPTRHQAIVVAGHAGATDIGTDLVDATSGRLADLPGKCGTAHAITAHAGFVGRHEFLRNPVELRVVFGREAWPFGRIGTAGAAALAIEEDALPRTR